MKVKFKRIMAWVITLCMMLTMVPAITVAAADNDAAGTNSPVVFTKELIETAAGQPNLIKLEAYVTGEVEQTGASSAADIILVLDQSGSMADKVVVNAGTEDEETMSKREVMIKNVRAFAEEIQKFNTADDDTYRLAVVGFASENSNTEILTLDPVRTYSWLGDNARWTYSRIDASDMDEDKTYYIQSGNSHESIEYYTYLFAADGWYTDGGIGLLGRGERVDVENTDIYEGTAHPSLTYADALVDCTAENIANGGIIDTAIDALAASGATRADLGMEMAQYIFETQPEGTYENRKKIVLLLTDGVPTTSSNFSDTVANGAVQYAKTMKDGGAHVFSAYFGTPTQDSENFLQAVSSNYPDATAYTNLGTQAATSYYTATAEAGAITKLFSDIAYSIAAGMNLDENSVVRDEITEHFRLATIENNFDPEQIRVYTVDKTADGWSDTAVPLATAKVAVSEDGKTIDVSGFNFAYHCVTEAPKTEGGSDYGRKLVIYIPVVEDEADTSFGGYIPTNGSAGIFKTPSDTEAVVTAETAYQEAALSYSLVQGEFWKHLDLESTYTFNYDAETLNSLLDTMIPAGSLPDGTNNKGVRMEYQIIDTGFNSQGDYSDDVVIARLTVDAGEAVDVTDFSNWTLADEENTGKLLEIAEGQLSADAMYVLSCRLTSVTEKDPAPTLLEYSLLSVEVVRHGTHIVGGVIDNGGNITAEPDNRGTFLENTYTETVREGDDSATMIFTLKDGYEFAKIVELTTENTPLDTANVIFDVAEGIDDVDFESDGSFRYQATDVQTGTAVEVYTKLKEFSLTTEADATSEIRNSTTYTYSATEKLNVYFAAHTGYHITSLTFGEDESTAVTYTAEQLLAMSDQELAAIGVEIETAPSHVDGELVIVDGAVLAPRTRDNYVAVTSAKRSFVLTYKQYIRQTAGSAVIGYTPHGTDAEYVVEYGAALNAAPVAPGLETVINGANYTLSDWYRNHSGLTFWGVVDVSQITMPAANLTLHAFWQKNPDHNIAEIQVSKTALGSFEGEKTFTFEATMNESAVGTAEITVSAENPTGTAMMEIVITDRQNDLYENGTPIKIKEVDEGEGWMYDTDVYTIEYSNGSYVLKKDDAPTDTVAFTNSYNEFKVNYDLNGGKVGEYTEVDSRTVKWETANIGRYYIPSKDGAEFTGWKYNTTDVTTAMTYGELAGDPAVREITLVAQYSDNDYTVKYDLAGGNIGGETTLADKGVKWNDANLIPETNPAKAGATFTGWKKDETVVTNNSTYAELAGSTGVTEITLVAQYVGINYTVKYDLNGGKVGSHTTIDDKVVGWNDAELIPQGSPSKDGAIFTGWKFGNVDVTSTSTYAALAGAENVLEITLVAQYTEKNYTVIYDLNGGTLGGSSTVADKTNVKWNDANLLPEGTPQKGGYTFSGWERGAVVVNNQHRYSELADRDTVMQITLVAKYTENTYKVNYDLSGGNIEGATTIATKTGVKWSDANLLPAGTPVKDGYTFIEWREEGAAVDGSETYGSLAGDYSVEEITIVAYFEENPEVTYNDPEEVDEIPYNKYIKVDPKGGVWNHLGQVYTEATTLLMTEDRTLDKPTREDYTFMGWARTSGEGNIVYIYTAQWKEDKIGEVDPDHGDEIPDEYQKKIIFKVLNGTWADGTTADKAVVVTLMKEGKPDATGSASLTAPDGMIANAGYDTPGQWREEVPAVVSGTDAVTYTYVFHKTPDVVYDKFEENAPDPVPTTDEFAENDKIQVNPNGGIWNFGGVDYTEVETITLTDNIDLGTPTRDGYVFMGWDKAPGEGEIVYVYKAMWEVDEIGKVDPDEGDDVADIFQKKITFKIVNGTWDGVSKDDIVVVVDLLENGVHSVNGTAALEAPAAMIADYGYENGAWNVTPPASVSGTDSVTYIFTYVKKGNRTVEYDEEDPKIDEVEYGKYIKVDPNGGIWAHDGHIHTEAVELVMEDNRVLADPVREDYVFIGWVKSEGEDNIVYVYTAQWKEDKIGEVDPDDGDEIPDEYQKKIIFKVLNGTWADGTTADKTVVVTLMKDGKPDATGAASLTAPDGMIANAGYDTPGQWREEVPTTVTGVETEAYTYIFHKTPDVTYDEYKEEDPTPDPTTDEFEEQQKIQVNPNGGIWNFGGVDYTETETITLTDNIDLGTPTRDGYVFMGWDKAPGEGEIVYVYTAMWAVDEIGKVDPDDGDDVADKYQKKITFKIVNGKWSDGSTADIVKVVDLLDEFGEYSAAGTADISTIIPIGMSANSGYRNGNWDVEPPETVSGTEAATYTYTYKKSGGGGPSGPSGPSTTKYTLTYETNGGNALAKETHNSGKEVVLTKVPVKNGYVFEGWYLDADLTQHVTEVKMTKDITVYASWVEDNGSAGHGHQTPGSLNGDEHFAYVIGYPDETVRPNDNISRAEVTTIFFRLLKDGVRDANMSKSNDFADVEDGEWHNMAISTMAKLGIVKGRNENNFVPDMFITRAEFATICARFDDSEFEVIDSFTDVKGHWAEAEIHEAAAHGWIRGYEDGTFRPDAFITRAEAMTMINRVLNRVPESVEDLLSSMTKWSDNSDISAWYYLPIQEATNSHNFRMKNNIYETWTAMTANRDWTAFQN